jgi:hypothetical protein
MDLTNHIADSQDGGKGSELGGSRRCGAVADCESG